MQKKRFQGLGRYLSKMKLLSQNLSFKNPILNFILSFFRPKLGIQIEVLHLLKGHVEDVRMKDRQRKTPAPEVRTWDL